MKKLYFGAFLVFLLNVLPIHATEYITSAEVNGTPLGDAFYENGYTYVPLRRLLAVLDENFSLSWERETKCAVGTVGGHFLTVKIGSHSFFLDGVEYKAPQALFIQDGATYVPLRTAAEALGLAVRYDGSRASAVAEGALLPPRYTSGELDLLAHLIRAESEGECIAGQVAVGNVVLNRVASPCFASSVEAVINERINGYYQFTPVENGSIRRSPDARARIAAVMALSGFTAVGEALYFFDPRYSAGTWITSSCRYLTEIGCHRFYC